MSNPARVVVTRTVGPQLKWPGVLFWALVAASLTCAYLAVRPAASPTEPSLYWNPAQGQLGDVNQGDVLSATFDVFNRYPDSVEITEVSAGCSCRTASASRNHLEPGEGCSVQVTWSVGSRRGRVVDSVSLVYAVAGARSPSWASLRLEANVRPDIRYEPDRVKFRLGEPGTARVILTPGRMPSFAVRDVFTNATALKASFLPERSEVEVRYTPESDLDAADGRFVAVATDSPNEPQLRIPVVVQRP